MIDGINTPASIKGEITVRRNGKSDMCHVSFQFVYSNTGFS